jgi:hypothetical protein
MEPVGRQSEHAPAESSGSAVHDLSSLWAKVDAWGPMESARLLLDRNTAAQTRVAGLEIEVRQEQLRRLRLEQKRFLDEQARQAEKAGDWKLAGSVLGCLDQVLVGVCRIGQDYHQARTDLAAYQSKVTGVRLRLAGELRDEVLTSLQGLCDAEQKMAERLEQQYNQQLSTRDAVLAGMRRA